MSLRDVRRLLVERLEEGDRGDRGWFVITRVHVALAWLEGIAEYLANRGGRGVIELTRYDYQRLGTIVDIDSDDPGVQLRRHHLLAMDKPLQLLRRVDGNWWRQIALTERGHELAHTDDPAAVVEEALASMRFAVEPWSPPTRVSEYGEFDVRVYDVTKLLLQTCGGYIDRDEFDFFVSRIRTEEEADWAASAIWEYRTLTHDERNSLHAEIRKRIPGAKAYSNWRDVGLHTFSLFSLGTSMVREDTRLLLTRRWVGERARKRRADGGAATRLRRGGTGGPRKLRMPEPPEAEDLLTPPAAPAVNAGADAESFVAKVLRSQGWKIAFYTNRRGYGFDLWALKGNRAMVIEVKSSVGILDAVSLTPTEYEAAQTHADSYFLALVEHIASASPQLRIIQNPVANVRFDQRTAQRYVISRSEWLRATE